MPKGALVLKSEDIKRFNKYLEKNPDVMLKHGQIALKKSTLLIERSAKMFAPASEGTLRKSIKSTIKPSRSKIAVGVKYGAAVHEGSRPHWPPFEPNSSLDRWARAKNIPTFLVAKAIARSGTKAQPFMDEALDWEEHNINQLIKKALDDTAEEIAKA